MGGTGGWNRPSANQPTVKTKKRGLSPAVKGVVAGAVVVLGAVFAYVCLFGNADEHPAKLEKERGRIKEVTPAKVGAAKVVREERQSAESSTATPVATTNAVRPKANVNPGLAARIDAALGRTNNTARATNQLFKTRADVILSMLTPVAPGAVVPPPPVLESDNNDPRIAKALAKALEEDENDSDEDRSRKRDVQAMKEELNELRKDGMTFTEYVKALTEKRNADAEFLSEAKKLNNELYEDKSITDEEYREAKKKISALLAERGLPDVKSDAEADAEAEAQAHVREMADKALKVVREKHQTDKPKNPEEQNQ